MKIKNNFSMLLSLPLAPRLLFVNNISYSIIIQSPAT